MGTLRAFIGPTPDAFVIKYDETGYTVYRGGEIVLSHRLEPICYLLDTDERELLAKQHALMDIKNSL